MKKLAALILFAVAALTASAASKTADHVDIKLSFMLVGGTAADFRLVSPELPHAKTVAEFTPQQRERTKDYRYSGAPTAQLQSRADAQSEWKSMGEIAIPSGVARAIVFIAPDRATGGSRAYLLPESGPAVKPGELVLFNGTGVPLAVQVGKEQMVLQPGGLPPVPMAGYREDIVQFAAAAQTAGGWVKVADGEMQFTSSRRTYLLLLPPRKARAPSLQIYSVVEEVPVQETMVVQR